MSEDIQNVKIEANVFEPTELELKFTKKGESKPSKIFQGFSGLPNVEYVPTYSLTNYIPGKVAFTQMDDK